MLKHIEIRNVALIEEVAIDFKDNLNILTGETGAGKSILIDSINAVLGARTTRDIIRTGTKRADIQAVFTLEEKQQLVIEDLGIPVDSNELVLYRQINATGKTVCRANGIILNVSQLKKVGDILIDISGQHDNQQLMNEEIHIQLLDLFAGNDLIETKDKYQNLLKEWKDISAKINDLTYNEKERLRTIDLLQYQISEIKEAHLILGEEEELKEKSTLLKNSEKIVKVLNSSYQFISGDSNENNILNIINNILGEVELIENLGSDFRKIKESIEDILYRFEDVNLDIRETVDSMEFEPEIQQEVEERLDIIFNLKLKYGDSIEEILKYYESSCIKLSHLQKSSVLVDEYIFKKNQIEEELNTLCGIMHEKRVVAANKLDTSISIELNQLNMKKADYKTNINYNRDNPYLENGKDTVEFLISPNEGEPLKPLSKIASGGEMSRIMLAIKIILADIEQIPTLIFDEIDSGISGDTAGKTGAKLYEIARNRQVICVTHIAGIASLADTHFLIEKQKRNDRTVTNVTQLSMENKKREIARLLGNGKITENTLKLAKEMIDNN